MNDINFSVRLKLKLLTIFVTRDRCCVFCQQPFIPHDTTSQQTRFFRERYSNMFKKHKPQSKIDKGAKYCARPKAVRMPGHFRWPALAVCDGVTCPSGESGLGNRSQRGGGGGSADQVQTKKAAVLPAGYLPALCFDGVAATARLSLDDLGDRVPPLGVWVLHTDDCAGGKE